MRERSTVRETRRKLDGERETPEGERDDSDSMVERDDGDSGRGRETDGGEEDKVRVLLSFAH